MTSTRRPASLVFRLRTVIVALLAQSSLVALAHARPTNVTVAQSNSNFSGTGWSCSDLVAVDTGACPTGCRTATIGDSVSVSFEGSAAWLTLQRDVASSVVLSVTLDGVQSTILASDANTQADCAGVLLGANMDPTKTHFATLSVLSASPGDPFIFGGVTFATDSKKVTADNITGQTLLPPPSPENVALIVAVLGGVISFWLVVGLFLWHVRRVRSDEPVRNLQSREGPRTFDKAPLKRKPPQEVDATLVAQAEWRNEKVDMLERGVVGDKNQKQLFQFQDYDRDAEETVVEKFAPAPAPSGSVVQRSAFGTTRTVGTTRSSISSYPETIDVPLPSAPLPPLPPQANLTIDTRLDDPFRDPKAAGASSMTKEERELQRGIDAVAVVRQLESARAPDDSGSMSAGSATTSAAEQSAISTALPMYTPNKEAASGMAKRWM